MCSKDLEDGPVLSWAMHNLKYSQMTDWGEKGPTQKVPPAVGYPRLDSQDQCFKTWILESLILWKLANLRYEIKFSRLPCEIRISTWVIHLNWLVPLNSISVQEWKQQHLRSIPGSVNLIWFFKFSAKSSSHWVFGQRVK